MIAGIICYFRGHVWRRLRKGEVSVRESAYAKLPIFGMAEGIASLRICNRCKLVRQVKARAKKEKAG